MVFFVQMLIFPLENLDRVLKFREGRWPLCLLPLHLLEKALNLQWKWETNLIDMRCELVENYEKGVRQDWSAQRKNVFFSSGEKDGSQCGMRVCGNSRHFPRHYFSLGRGAREKVLGNENMEPCSLHSHVSLSRRTLPHNSKLKQPFRTRFSLSQREIQQRLSKFGSQNYGAAILQVP